MAEVATWTNTQLPLATTTPLMDGTGSAGSATTVSRSDHRHPTDTTLAPLASPGLTGTPTAPTVTPATDSSTKLATTAFVQSAIATLAPTAPAGAINNVGRNLIHNPMFNIQQRGVGSWSANNSFMADRWVLYTALDTGINFNIFAVSDAVRSQIGDEAAKWMLSGAFTGNAGAGSYTQLRQNIESVNRLSGKTVTISFYAVAAAAGTKVGINMLQNFGSGGSPSAVVGALTTGLSVTLSAGWARYSVTITLPSIAGKTLGTNGDDFTGLQLFLSSGSTNNAGAGNIGVQTGTVQFWGVQLEIGTAATPLEKPDPQQDLAKCQRFYQTFQIFAGGYSGAAIAAIASIMFPVVMRATPALAVTTNSDVSLTSPTHGANTMFAYAQGTTPAGASGWQLSRVMTASADL